MTGFAETISQRGIDLSPRSLATLQVNITKLCNQACTHCHVDSSPLRKESMSRENVERIIGIIKNHKSITTLDITGGAPELHPEFKFLVESVSGIKIIVRHNLTVTMDPHPSSKESMEWIPEFFARHKVEVASSLPSFDVYFTDKQRGRGVFEKSIESLQKLNLLGYGSRPELRLNLVYNPAGAFLPAAQGDLELRYKNELKAKYGIIFNELFVITNMPIKRFSEFLKRSHQYEEYMEKLQGAFNAEAAKNVMCRDMISVDHAGFLYDCDFNQMLDLGMDKQISSRHLKDFSETELLTRKISLASHCYGCTAGQGSSCGGNLS